MNRRTKQELEALYELQMGKPPPELPEDHPDRWQWEYRGTPEERQQLLDRLTGNEIVEFEEQEALF